MPEQDQTGPKWAAEIRVTITVPPDWTTEEDQQLAAKLEELRVALARVSDNILSNRCGIETAIV